MCNNSYSFDIYLRDNSERLLSLYPEFACLFTDEELLGAVYHARMYRNSIRATASAIRDKSIIASSRLLLDRSASDVANRYPGDCLSDLIQAGFPFQMESVRKAAKWSHNVYLKWLLVPSYQHDLCPKHIQRITKLLYTMRCVPDCIIGALSPELIEHVVYFVL